MELSTYSKIKLNNDVEISLLGFGTWELDRNSAYQPVKWALEEGYQLIDTAAIYANEKWVGKAIKESDMSREDIFVTSKVWNSDHGYEKTLKAYDDSLKRLGLRYLDLYLIHWPRGTNKETWSALETIYKEKKVKSIGVSNFMVKDLEVITNEHEIIPTVNQIIMHPLKYQENKSVVEYCIKKDIKIEAYSPLTHGDELGLKVFQKIANKYEKTVPQILIRWSLQHGFICIPRSSKKEHIIENADVFNFELSTQDMAKLNSIQP